MHTRQANLEKPRRGGCRLFGTLSVLLASFAATGCQVDIGGQTLPSSYYLTDDVQYFAPGPEFKLAQEAAQMQAFRADQAEEGP